MNSIALLEHRLETDDYYFILGCHDSSSVIRFFSSALSIERETIIFIGRTNFG